MNLNTRLRLLPHLQPLLKPLQLASLQLKPLLLLLSILLAPAAA